MVRLEWYSVFTFWWGCASVFGVISWLAWAISVPSFESEKTPERLKFRKGALTWARIFTVVSVILGTIYFCVASA